jgi:hypothetical protein
MLIPATLIMKAEYRSQCDRIRHVNGFINFFGELGMPLQLPILIYADNLQVINLAKNLIAYLKAKHIDVPHHYQRDQVNKGRVELTYVPTEKQLADLLTKPTPRPAHHRWLKSIRLLRE